MEQFIKYPIEYSAFIQQTNEHLSYEIVDNLKANTIEIHFMADNIKEEEILILRWVRTKLYGLVIQSTNHLLRKHKHLLNIIMNSRLDISYYMESPTNFINFTIRFYIKEIKPTVKNGLFNHLKMNYREIYLTSDYHDLADRIKNDIDDIFDNLQKKDK